MKNYAGWESELPVFGHRAVRTVRGPSVTQARLAFAAGLLAVGLGAGGLLTLGLAVAGWLR